jgi:glycosyltransferase involved in cell wall biosynthesis
VFRNKFVAIVVPAYNEERHIAQVIESTPDLVDLLVVVDDGSSDATPNIVRDAQDPRVTLLRHSSNRGVGAAIVTGYRFALEQGADVVGVMGGDAQMDTAHLPALLKPVVEGRCDFTKGNRFYSLRSWRGMPVHRAIGNVILSFLTKPASGYWHVFDAQNGYTMISSGALRRLPLDRLETGYQFENRLLIYLNASDARVTDVPVPARYGDEESGIKLWRDVPAILWTLLTGFLMRVRHKYLRERVAPAGTLILSGILLLAFGLLMALWAWITIEPPWLSWAVPASLSLAGVAVGSFIVMDLVASRGLRYRRQPASSERMHDQDMITEGDGVGPEAVNRPAQRSESIEGIATTRSAPEQGSAR